MLPPDTLIECEQAPVPISRLNENDFVFGVAGWGETKKTTVKELLINNVENCALLTLTTASGATLRCSSDQLCFARMNPHLRYYSLYLHERSNIGFRLSVTNDLMKEMLTMSVSKANQNTKNDIIDKIWIIDNSPNLSKINFLEKMSMFKYGIPNMEFEPLRTEVDFTAQMLKELYNQIDTPARASQLLRDQNMYYDHPHIKLRVTNSANPVSNAIQFIIFGCGQKSKKGGFPHLIQIDGSLQSNASEHNAFKRKQSKHGLWYLEITREDLEEAELFVRTLSHLDSLSIVKKIQLSTKAPFYILPASHLKPGMLVPIINKKGEVEEDVVDSIKTEKYSGILYTLKIDNIFNFITGSWLLMCYDPLKFL